MLSYRRRKLIVFYKSIIKNYRRGTVNDRNFCFFCMYVHISNHSFCYFYNGKRCRNAMVKRPEKYMYPVRTDIPVKSDAQKVYIDRLTRPVKMFPYLNNIS